MKLEFILFLPGYLKAQTDWLLAFCRLPSLLPPTLLDVPANLYPRWALKFPKNVRSRNLSYSKLIFAGFGLGRDRPSGQHRCGSPSHELPRLKDVEADSLTNKSSEKLDFDFSENVVVQEMLDSGMELFPDARKGSKDKVLRKKSRLIDTLRGGAPVSK